MTLNRRDFIAAGVLTASAVAHQGLGQSATAIKTVRTNVLEIGYHESGPATGFPVIMLHGFPDDAHAYDGVAPALAKAGYRALAVYLRGYGTETSGGAYCSSRLNSAQPRPQSPKGGGLPSHRRYHSSLPPRGEC